MSEYIFDVPDSNQPISGDTSLYYPDERDEPMMVCEEIVLCRDCMHSFADGTVCWNPMFVHSELFEGEWDDFPADVKPNGFCAWAVKRKEGGE